MPHGKHPTFSWDDFSTQQNMIYLAIVVYLYIHGTDVWIWIIDPYSSPLFQRHWHNHMVSPLLVMGPRSLLEHTKSSEVLTACIFDGMYCIFHAYILWWATQDPMRSFFHRKRWGRFGCTWCMKASSCSKTCLVVLIRSIFAREKLHERFSASAVFPAQNRTN